MATGPNTAKLADNTESKQYTTHTTIHGNAEPTTSNHPIATDSTIDTLPDTTKSNPGTHLIPTEPTHPMSTGPTTAMLADNPES